LASSPPRPSSDLAPHDARYLASSLPVARDPPTNLLSRGCAPATDMPPLTGLVLRSHTHTHTVLSRSSIIPLRAKTRCTSKTDSPWRALHHTTLIPGLRPGGLALGYKHSAPLGLGERLKS